jgi:hypothetical protein
MTTVGGVFPAGLLGMLGGLLVFGGVSSFLPVSTKVSDSRNLGT